MRCPIRRDIEPFPNDNDFPVVQLQINANGGVGLRERVQQGELLSNLVYDHQAAFLSD
ncbi:MULTISPECIES: hypothetical protein [unclassified Marinobacter]|uniref:hypothetical protein n=1 Tax=unclassified Marinobacter TaxID=83889 RepID=UPI001D0CF0E0|nr:MULTISPECIES: hypothetical protein [unclassified Marinobacter]